MLRSRWSIGFVLAALFAVGLRGAPLPAQAAGQDYHSEAFGDPLDFSNTEDHVIADEGMLFQTTNASISDGQLHFDADRPAYFSVLWSGYPTGVPHGREGAVKPIDAGHYRRLVLRINASAPLGAGVRWYSCREANAGCQGGQNFALTGGWQTVDLPLTGDPGSGAAPWGGSIVGLRVVFAPNGPTHIDVDWARIVPDGLGEVTELTGGAPPAPIPSDRLDYATFAGNPWDFDAMTDVEQAINLRSVGAAGNRLSGCNVATGSLNGDPGLLMNLPSGLPIDANRFKTLTVVYSYSGPFSVKNVKGGGMVARVFWFDARGIRYNTKGIHLYPNETSVTIRLDAPGVGDGASWRGTVNGFRWDPNQDPGDRCWTVDRILLTADEPGGASAPPSAASAPGATPARAPAKARALTTRKAPARSKAKAKARTSPKR